MTIQSIVDNGQVYQVTLTDGTIKWVPKDSGNTDYITAQQWIANGGTVTQGGEPA